MHFALIQTKSKMYGPRAVVKTTAFRALRLRICVAHYGISAAIKTMFLTLTVCAERELYWQTLKAFSSLRKLANLRFIDKQRRNSMQIESTLLRT